MIEAAEKKLETKCTACGRKLRYSAASAGRKGKCSCGAVLVMPRVEDPPAPPSVQQRVDRDPFTAGAVPSIAAKPPHRSSLRTQAGTMNWSLRFICTSLRVQGWLMLLVAAMGLLLAFFAAFQGGGPTEVLAAIGIFGVGVCASAPFFAAAEIVRLFWSIADETRRHREFAESCASIAD